MRKLAREAVILGFLGAVIAGVFGFVHERGEIMGKQGLCYIEHDPGNPIWDGVRPLGPCYMDGKLIPQLTPSMCAGDLVNGHCTKLSAEGEAAEANAPSIISIQLLAVSGIFGVIGFAGGIVAWSVYRLARFAITG